MGSNFYDEIKKKSSESDIINIIKSMGSYAFDSYYLKRVLAHRCSSGIMRALVDNRCVNRLSFREFIEILDIVEADSFINIFKDYTPLERCSGGYQIKESASSINSNCNTSDLCRKLPSYIKFSGTQIAELVNYSYNKMQFLKNAIDYGHVYSISISKVKDILRQISDESYKLQCLQLLQNFIEGGSSASDILEQFKNDQGKQQAAKILRINYQPANQNSNQSSSNQNNQISSNQNNQISSNQNNQISSNNYNQNSSNQNNQNSSNQNKQNQFDYENNQQDPEDAEDQIQRKKAKNQYIEYSKIYKKLNQLLLAKQQQFDQLYEKQLQESLQINLSDSEYIEINKKAMKQLSNLQKNKIILLKYESIIAMFQKIPKLKEDYVVFTSNMVQVMERQLRISIKKGKEKEIYRDLYISQNPEYGLLIKDHKIKKQKLNEVEGVLDYFGIEVNEDEINAS
ncbi:hypothetical protein ABPG72_010102 [Tetrahymena utriculariae]